MYNLLLCDYESVYYDWYIKEKNYNVIYKATIITSVLQQMSLIRVGLNDFSQV